LLYFGAEREYKQAKLRAARTLGVRYIPTNFEVALELDKVAEENEGVARKERLIQLRLKALKIMTMLAVYSPRLIGSVWRGTIREGSDIDIVVYHDLPIDVVNLLKAQGFEVSRTEWVTVTKSGLPESSFHIYIESPGKQRIEIVVRSPEEAKQKRKCDVFGDELKGLTIRELGTLLRENPTQRFVPS